MLNHQSEGVDFFFDILFIYFYFVGFVKNQLSWFNKDLGFLIKIDLLQLYLGVVNGLRGVDEIYIINSIKLNTHNYVFVVILFVY